MTASTWHISLTEIPEEKHLKLSLDTHNRAFAKKQQLHSNPRYDPGNGAIMCILIVRLSVINIYGKVHF